MVMMTMMITIPTQVILCLLSSLLDLGLLAKPRAADQNGKHHHHHHQHHHHHHYHPLHYHHFHSAKCYNTINATNSLSKTIDVFNGVFTDIEICDL